jgi:7-cyano-7-deazaguanine synthase
MKKQAVLSLSGGMDSSSLLLHLLANGYEVTALSFDYGQKHNVELERAKELVDYLNSKADEVKYKSETSEVILHHFLRVKHQVITLDGLAQLLNSSLVSGGSEVPEGHYAEENMKATVVPNRNKIFSSIIQAVALSIAEQKDTECVIAMGIHSGDHAVYPDCRQEFRDIDYEAFKAGNWGAEKVTYYTPYLTGDKYTILEDGATCCDILGLGFNAVYSRTNTSYKPYPSGNSDYKSASSVERVEAFIKLGRPDPVQYEDETGLVDWETVVQYVQNILTNHEATRS